MSVMRGRLSLLLLLLSGTCAVASKPVALVGGGYGQYVRNSMIKKVLLPMEVAYEDLGDSMDWGRLDEFSLVIVAHGDEKLLAGDAAGPAFDRYVGGGGHVLLIGNAPTALLGSRVLDDYPWIGAHAWGYQSNAPTSVIARPDHPWLAHLQAGHDYYWLQWSQFLVGPTTADVLIGSEQRAFLTRNEYGAGWTVFLSRGPFPYAAENVGPEREAQMRMLQAMVAEAEPLTVPEQIAQAMATEQHAVVLWQRDWQFGSKEGPQFRPPYPLPGEELSSISLDLARAEREDFQINLLPLRDLGEVSVSVSELDGPAGPRPAVEVRVMGRAPLIPWDKPDVQAFESPFWLMDPKSLPPEGSPAFRPRPLSNTVVWLEVTAPEDCAPGVYRGQVAVTGAETLPLTITVWPVLMPQDRLFQLKYWGGSTPDVRQWDQLQQQGCCNASLSYPDLTRVMVPELGISLAEALKSHPDIFGRDPFPALDFSYLDEYMGMQAERGLTVVKFQDVRTGTIIANAATGLNLDWGENWRQQVTAEWQRAWVGYYAELMAYLRSKGYRRVEPIWTDEPTLETIEQRYLPPAELYLRAGMFPGSHWTTPGFMSPEQVNRFAHAVGDWSMYSIMMPNFFRFLREGSVKLIDGARVGQTRGGSGYLHRSPADASRRLCWDAWHNGATYLRTGPLWKAWLYYLNYEKYIRDEGIAGERLIAYSTPDPSDLSAPMLPSPDWIAAREGADDVNLVMVLQYYLQHLRGTDGVPQALLDELQTELEDFVGPDSPYNLHLESRHYEHADMAYDYTVTVDATSADLRRARRRVLEMLAALASYADRVPVTLSWHEVELSRAGAPVGAIHCLDQQRSMGEELSEWLALRTGLRYPVALGLDADQPGIFVAQSGEEGLEQLAAAHGWDLQRWSPRAGSYSIFTDAQAQVVAVVGADEVGLQRGLRAFRAFCSPRGHWLRSIGR